jgi:hypothetical protein
MAPIARQVASIDTVATLYRSKSGTDRLDIATDILVDLAHWCHTYGIDLDRAMARMRYHVEAERAEAEFR